MTLDNVLRGAFNHSNDRYDQKTTPSSTDSLLQKDRLLSEHEIKDKERKFPQAFKVEEKRNAKEKQAAIMEEEKEEKKDRRLAKEMDRERRYKQEDREKGYAGYLGCDLRSDLRATRRALGVEIRKRMPGTSWK
ncbi:MAG: hypothetical protein Q9209_005912 [Squamulea sp. 1 TL-2023]